MHKCKMIHEKANRNYIVFLGNLDKRPILAPWSNVLFFRQVKILNIYQVPSQEQSCIGYFNSPPYIP